MCWIHSEVDLQTALIQYKQSPVNKTCKQSNVLDPFRIFSFILTAECATNLTHLGCKIDVSNTKYLELVCYTT